MLSYNPVLLSVFASFQFYREYLFGVFALYAYDLLFSQVGYSNFTNPNFSRPVGIAFSMPSRISSAFSCNKPIPGHSCVRYRLVPSLLIRFSMPCTIGSIVQPRYAVASFGIYGPACLHEALKKRPGSSRSTHCSAFFPFAHSIKESLGLSAGKDTITTFLILSDSGPCGPAVAWRAGQNRFFKVLYAGPATAHSSLSL